MGISDDGGQLSHVSWLGSPAGNRESAGLIVVWQMCYPVQHMLDAAASMASSAIFGGFCCGRYLAAVTTTVVYGTGVGRTQLRNTAVKVDGRLPFKVCHPRLSPATRGQIVEQVICTCPQPDWLWDRFYGRPYHLGSHRNVPGAAAIRTWTNVLEWRLKTGEASSKLKQALVQRPRMFGVA